MSFREENIIYFSEKETTSLDKTLERVKERAEKLRIKSIVVASTSGETGVRASEMFKGYNVVVVTHHFRFREPNTTELTEENKKRILANGGKILTTTHALEASGGP